MPWYISGAACWWLTAPKPPVNRRSSARCTSRRWRLLYIPAGEGLAAEPPSPPEEHDGCRLYHHRPVAGVVGLVILPDEQEISKMAEQIRKSPSVRYTAYRIKKRCNLSKMGYTIFQTLSLPYSHRAIPAVLI